MRASRVNLARVPRGFYCESRVFSTRRLRVITHDTGISCSCTSKNDLIQPNIKISLVTGEEYALYMYASRSIRQPVTCLNEGNMNRISRLKMASKIVKRHAKQCLFVDNLLDIFWSFNKWEIKFSTD